MINLNSLYFPIALTVLAIVYYSVPQKYQNVILLTSSLVFYFSFSLASGLWLIISIFLLYFLSAYLNDQRWGNVAFILSLVLTIGSLLVLKYLGFVLRPFGITVFDGIFAPLGISFYSFQSFSYIMDIRKGKMERENSFLIFALYISFFPSLLSGPISRAESMLPQYHSGRTFNRSNLDVGVSLYISGLFKKAVLADTLGYFVDGVFSDFGVYSGITLIASLFAFALQLYFDFSGYTDMAIGAAKVLGINLPVNFTAPNYSFSYREFWKRWHISLTKWFTDYLYISLGGNRKGAIRKYLNIIIVFAVSGLWHGAGLTFLVWGFIQGAFRIIDEFIWGKNIPENISLIKRCFGMIYVNVVWAFSMVFFRANNISDAMQYLGHCVSPGGFGSLWNQTYNILGACIGGSSVYIRMFIALFGVGLAAVLLFDISVYKNKENIVYSPVYCKPVMRIAYLSLAIVLILICGNFGTSSFIYFNF